MYIHGKYVLTPETQRVIRHAERFVKILIALPRMRDKKEIALGHGNALSRFSCQHFSERGINSARPQRCRSQIYACA